MTKTLCTVFLLMAGVVLAAETALYKYVDDNGVIHYSQTKIDDRYEAITPPPISVVPSQLKTTAKPSGSDDEEDTVSPKELLKSFRITSPKPEENLWGTGQSVTASAEVAATLLEIYDVQYVLDGKAKPANNRATQKFTEVNRGEHKIYGQLVMKGSNRVIKKTEEVTFFIHQHSKK